MPGEPFPADPADTLTGGTVQPGFAVPVADLFAALPPDPPPAWNAASLRGAVMPTERATFGGVCFWCTEVCQY